MFGLDNILDGDSGGAVVDSHVHDTRQFKKQAVLCIYNNPAVLNKIDAILSETPLVYLPLEVSEGEKIDLQVHPAFENKSIKVYLMPLDYTLPGGGVQPLIPRMNDSSRIVFMTDKPSHSSFSPFKPLTTADRNIECFVGVNTQDLLSNTTTEKFKQFLQYLVDYNPLHVLLFSPGGYEKMEENVNKYFKSLRIDPDIDPARNLDEALEKLTEKPYDEIRLPKSYRDYPEDMDKIRRAALNKRMWILYGSRDNGVYFIGNMD
jgi:hypothetical protein